MTLQGGTEQKLDNFYSANYNTLTFFREMEEVPEFVSPDSSLDKASGKEEHVLVRQLRLQALARGLASDFCQPDVGFYH